MVYGCLVKSFAFITALMSIAVLASSIAVLVSAVAYSRIDRTEETNNSTQTSDSTTPFTLSPTNHAKVENASAMDDEIPLVVPNVTMTTTTPLSTTTTPSTTTTSTILLNEKEEKKNMTEELSTSMSPASTFPDTTTASSSRSSSNESTSVYPDNIEDVDGSFKESSNSTVEANPKTDSLNAFLENQHDFWEAKTDTYIMLIQASSGTGIFSGLLQLVFSWLLICGMAKDLKDRTSIWNLSNFIGLILALVIILVPLAYNNTKDAMNSPNVFWREICSNINSLEFSSELLETILNSITNFLTKDLALYYYILGVNAFILLVLLIPPLFCCCIYPCKRFCCKGKRERSESDLMLFETGTGGRSATLSGLDRY